MQGIILIEVPEETIGTMCAVTYVGEDNTVKEQPCRILGYDRLEVDIKMQS